MTRSTTTSSSPTGEDPTPLAGVLRAGSPLREQLLVLADVRETTLSSELLAAIAAHVETARQDPELRARALQICGAIAFDADRRIERLARIFGLTDHPAVSAGADLPAA